MRTYFLFSLAFLSSVFADMLGPFRHPDLETAQVEFASAEPFEWNFYRARNASGTPAYTLKFSKDEKNWNPKLGGLFQGDQRICTQEEMSYYSFHCSLVREQIQTQDAELFLTVQERIGNILRVKIGKDDFYADTSTLPRKASVTFSEPPNVRKRRAKAGTESVLKEKEFRRFLTDLRNCANGKERVKCLPDFFMEPKIYFRFKDDHDNYIQTSDFARRLASHPDVEKAFLTALAADKYPKLEADGLDEPPAKTVFLHYGECTRIDLERTERGWKIKCFSVESCC